MDFLPEKINDYVEKHSQPEPELLAKLNRETWQKNDCAANVERTFAGARFKYAFKIDSAKKYS